jgi:signal recognition particle receptor subunit beta
MVNVGILGAMDCGKTSVFAYFMNHISMNGETIISGAPGGPEKYATETVDFIRFTAKGFIHVLYGTGGHKRPITDYYRLFVLRNADRFLCMFDLSTPIEPQIEFFEEMDIPLKSVLILLNKYDLGKENFETYKEKIQEYFVDNKKKLIKAIYPTVAIEYKDTDEYLEYNHNCVKAILDLCEFDKESAFDLWEGQ